MGGGGRKHMTEGQSGRSRRAQGRAGCTAVLPDGDTETLGEHGEGRVGELATSQPATGRWYACDDAP